MKRFLTLMLALVLVFTCIPMTPVRADTTDPDEYVLDEAFYENMMGQDIGMYFSTCQPDNAILLGQNVKADASGQYPENYQPVSSITLSGAGNVLETHSSPNVNGGRAVYQLPRLQQEYHYVVSDKSSGWAITEDLYPKLIRRGETLQVTLLVVSHRTGDTLYTINITDDGTAAKATSDDLNESFTAFKDMIENGAFVSNGEVRLYRAELQETSIIMPQYIYSSESSFEYSWSPVDLKANAVQFMCQPLNANGTVTSYDIKNYNSSQLHAGNHQSLLFGGSKYEDCTYNNNIGQSTTVTRANDEFPLWYFIATDFYLYVGKIAEDVSYDDEWSKIAEDAEGVTWKASAYNTVPHLQEWGPISYEKFWLANGSKFEFRNGMYLFSHESTTTQQMNLFAQSLIFAGVIPHVATLTLEQKPDTLTINYYIFKPGETSPSLWKSVDYSRSAFSPDGVEVPPEYANYTAEKWYTDATCTRLQSFTNIPSGNSTMSVFTKYNWAGGEYTVNFYNDHLGNTATMTFQANEQPTLPTEIKGFGGYKFKNWLIVETEDAVSGTVYNPSTFTPEPGRTYTFKTQWDIVGVIVQVICADKNFDLGTEITKNMLSVYVQEDETPATRILGDDEYEMSGNVVTKEGVNQFVITYTATGATAVCEVNGVLVKPIGITAEYRYSDPRLIGATLTNLDFVVTEFYSNNTTKTITEGFSFTPNVLSTVGRQEITVTYNGQEAKCYIDVIDKTNTPSTGENKTLSSITAAYTGGILYVGDNINPNNIYVVATYSDISMAAIPVSDIQYSPTNWSTAGDQQLTVTYGGKQARCTVSVVSRNTGTGTNQPNAGGTPTPTPSPTPSPAPTATPAPTANPGQTGRPTSTATPSGTGSGGSNTTPGESPKPSSPQEAVTQLDKLTDPVSKDMHLASPGYIRGSTVMTSVLTGTDYVTSDDEYDIFEMISNTDPEQKSLYMKLVNGATTNLLTSETLEVMKERGLILTVDMLQSTDHSYTLARWIIDGSGIDVTSRMVDLNIVFSIDDTKESDKQVMMSVASGVYPDATQLTVYPPVDSFPSGATVRLYTCSSAKKGSKLIKTFQWSDVMNSVSMNVADNWYYVLSDSMSPYPDGSDLEIEIDAKVEPSTPDAEDDPVIGGDSQDEGDDFWGDDSEEDWGSSTTPEPTTSKKGISPFMIAMIGAGILLLAAIIAVIVILLMKNKTPKGPKPPKQKKEKKSSKGPKGIPTGPEVVPAGPESVDEEELFDAEPDESDEMFDEDDDFLTYEE